MIYHGKTCYILETKHTSYAFLVMGSKHLEHLYYGEKLMIPEACDIDELCQPLHEKREFAAGNAVVYAEEWPALSLEDTCLEFSAYGKGDIREPFIEIEFADGSVSNDFLFESASVHNGKEGLAGLPSAYAQEEAVQQLTVVLRERCHAVKLELLYSVFPETDVIVRSARVTNEGKDPVTVKRLMSTQIDFDENGLVFTGFTGAWSREMNRSRQICSSGLYINQTMAGVSSNRANPFVILSRQDTTEEYGDCYGCNLIYSGNHYEALEVNPYGKSRFVSGINPKGFSWELKEKEQLEAPESVMSYTNCGFETLSRQMHDFIRSHIVRGMWKEKERPVLLNSWEAAYFDFNENKLLKLAGAAKEAGIELFVMDDGWFGNRKDDHRSLGDWVENTKKLPNGIRGIAEKINKLGLDFGIWVEPEMVNEDSDCYRAHPDWAVRIPGQPHSLGRYQMLLDLTREDVQEFIIESMRKVFSAGNVAYVKWDMNRIFSDAYSSGLPAHRQGEFFHRYVLGLYRILGILTSEFPKILFESCASGGNRFDLGMLCYMPQVWASDNTDAISRMSIQNGYSYGYPLSVIGAHVSGCPNHQTLRITPLFTRFHAACFGLLGYECNLLEMSKEEREAVRQQVALYKKWRQVFQFGDFYRLKDGSVIDSRNPAGSYHWLCVSKDKKRAVCMILQTKTISNTGYEKVRTRGLQEDLLYHFANVPRKIDIREFGDLINTISPIHIKKDSVMHELVSKFYRLQEEQEEYLVYGANLNRGGIKLKQAFSGTGFNENTRHYTDYASRMYFMESEESIEMKKAGK